MKEIKKNYTDFISICLSKKLQIQYNLEIKSDTSKMYELFSLDGILLYFCKINSIDDSNDVSNFESNYYNSSNLPNVPRDPYTGQPQVKPREVEGTLTEDFIRFTTGVSDSLDQ